MRYKELLERLYQIKGDNDWIVSSTDCNVTRQSALDISEVLNECIEALDDADEGITEMEREVEEITNEIGSVHDDNNRKLIAVRREFAEITDQFKEKINELLEL